MSNHIRNLEQQALRPTESITPARVADRLEGIIELLRRAPEAEAQKALWIAGESMATLLQEMWRAAR